MPGLLHPGQKANWNIQFPKLKLKRDERYAFLLNSLAPELTGTVFRKLPLSLEEAKV